MLRNKVCHGRRRIIPLTGDTKTRAELLLSWQRNLKAIVVLNNGVALCTLRQVTP